MIFCGFPPSEILFPAPEPTPRSLTEPCFIRHPRFGAQLAACFALNLPLIGGEGPDPTRGSAIVTSVTKVQEAGGRKAAAAAVTAWVCLSDSEPGSLFYQEEPPCQDLARCGCFSFAAMPWPPEPDTRPR